MIMHSQIFLSTFLMLSPFYRVNGNRWYNVEGYMEKIIRNHQVVIFSKTYCPYSVRMKNLLEKYNIKNQIVMELNLQPEMHVMQDYLKRKSGGIRTVPQLYVDGKFIGGFDTVKRKEMSGELAKIFTGAGITPKKSLLPRKGKC